MHTYDITHTQNNNNYNNNYISWDDGDLRRHGAYYDFILMMFFVYNVTKIKVEQWEPKSHQDMWAPEPVHHCNHKQQNKKNT